MRKVSLHLCYSAHSQKPLDRNYHTSILSDDKPSDIKAHGLEAITAASYTIAYSEVRNATHTGVVDGLENESPSLLQYKFFEAAPKVTLTQHSITVRPIIMSGKTFRNLPEALQTIDPGE